MELPAKKKKSRFKATLITLGIIVFITASVAYYHRQYLQLTYANLKYNHASINGKLYSAKWMVKDSNTVDVKLFRVASPVSPDVKGSDIAAESGWTISSSKLNKLKSTELGVYKGYKILDQPIGGKSVNFLFYEISPYTRALERDYDVTVPPGYKWTDGPFYIWSFEAASEKPTAFKRNGK